MANLETVDLARILTGDSQVKQKLYDAATRPGAFFLDLKSSGADIQYALAVKLKDFREDQPASSDRSADYTYKFADDEPLRDDSRLLPILQGESDLVRQFNKLCHAAALNMLSSLSDSLRLESDKRFEAHYRTTDSSDTGLKLIYEPSLVKIADVVKNKHTGSGAFNLLFHEQVGLHVYLPEQNRWEFSAIPAPGCTLVTAADFLQRLSASQFYLLPLHRVPQPRDGAGKRYFLSYFLRPSHTTKPHGVKRRRIVSQFGPAVRHPDEQIFP
ncbi:hypothetical protein N7526_004654 [Penicillium atrosanguineum]|nr:hypothetical protein N7526_004654 [Penicillium atrosanguineum]